MMADTKLNNNQPSVLGQLLTQAALVVIGLLTAFGLELTAVQIGAIVAAVGFLGLVLTFILWTTTVAKSTVVEKLVGREVVAGPANDMVEEGSHIRDVEATP